MPNASANGWVRANRPGADMGRHATMTVAFGRRSGERKKASGLRPKPREGFALRTHQGLGPWTAIHWVRSERGPTLAFQRPCRPPFPPDPVNGIQGPALVGIEGAKPLAGSGAEPRGFLASPKLPRQMRQLLLQAAPGLGARREIWHYAITQPHGARHASSDRRADPAISAMGRQSNPNPGRGSGRLAKLLPAPVGLGGCDDRRPRCLRRHPRPPCRADRQGAGASAASAQSNRELTELSSEIRCMASAISGAMVN